MEPTVRAGVEAISCCTDFAGLSARWSPWVPRVRRHLYFLSIRSNTIYTFKQPPLISHEFSPVGAGFSFRPFAAFDVERVMNAIKYSILLPLIAFAT
jgi:hypothetical protein